MCMLKNSTKYVDSSILNRVLLKFMKACKVRNLSTCRKLFISVCKYECEEDLEKEPVTLMKRDGTKESGGSELPKHTLPRTSPKSIHF